MPLDPNRAIDAFLQRTGASQAQYMRLHDIVYDLEDRAVIRRRLAVDAVFRLGVEWELLLHQWHVAAVSVDPSKLIGRHVSMIAKENLNLPDVLKAVFHASVTHRDVRVLTRRQIENLLDPRDRNITFRDASDWMSAARRDLSPTFVNKVGRIANELESASLLDFLKAVRDYVAHASPDSTARLNRRATLRSEGATEGLVGERNAPLLRPGGGVGNIGTFLSTDLGYPARTRADFIYERVRGLSTQLRVLS